MCLPAHRRNGNAPAPAQELGELIEQERCPAGREDLAEPPVAHSQRERILVAMAKTCA